MSLAVDMVVGAYTNRFDVAMLVAGDTDYVRAVKALFDLGKRVIWRSPALPEAYGPARPGLQREIRPG